MSLARPRHYCRRWRSHLKLVKKLAIALLLPYLLVLALLWVMQPRLLYHPSRVLPTTPAVHHLQYEEVWIPVNASAKHPERLHSWWMPHPKNRIGTLIYFHGADLNIGFNVAQAYWLRQLGFNVLLAEYRGYGLSEGSFPTEASLYADADAALAYLTQRGIMADEIFIYGHSLGGAIAINLAVDHPDLAGIIVQNSFTSMADMVTQFSYTRPYTRCIPVRWILNQRFESLQKISQLQVPVLLIHATGDPLIPATMGEQLYRAAHSFKELILVHSSVHHNAEAEYKDSRYLIKIQTFALKAIFTTKKLKANAWHYS
ncbi:MAG: alpha/beta fold hydrolase [Phormidesmis sp.]